jgi:peptide/nickel transport system permease protein
MAVEEVLSGAGPGVGFEEDLVPRSGRWRLGRWLARRVGLGLVSLVFVSILIFLLTHILPSDPARAILGHFAEPSQLKAVTKQLGLDKPLLTQYFSWMSGVVQGHLGTSFATKGSVTTIILPRLRNSLELLVLVAVIAVPLSILLGMRAAARRDSVFDHTVSLSTIGLTGLPEFVIGILLTLLLAVGVFHLLPAISTTAGNPLGSPKAMLLPVATLVVATLPYLTRLVRGSMIEALGSPYVEMARLKGVPERPVVRRHALRNALVPVTQGTGLTLIYLLGNVVVIETLFNYPGLGSVLVSSVSGRDLPMIQAIALVFAAMFILFNIVADLLTIFATPRLRTELMSG